MGHGDGWRDSGHCRPGSASPTSCGARTTGVWLLESGGRDVECRAQRLNRGQSVAYRSTGSTTRGSGRSVARVGTGSRRVTTAGRPVPWTRSISGSVRASASPAGRSSVHTWTRAVQSGFRPRGSLPIRSAAPTAPVPYGVRAPWLTARIQCRCLSSFAWPDGVAVPVRRSAPRSETHRRPDPRLDTTATTTPSRAGKD